MPRTQTLEAIVLKTYDVGEADRYCILFTKERGRLAARAHGVRKLTSRKGGSLIPFTCVNVELRESDSGLTVTSAAATGDRGVFDLQAFTAAAQGFELLLRLIQDEEPMPAAYAASAAFIRACAEGIPHASVAYGLRLLHLLGLLPDEKEIMTVMSLTGPEREYLQMAREGYFLRNIDVQHMGKLERIVERFSEEHLSGPLKAPGVIRAMEVPRTPAVPPRATRDDSGGF